MNQIEITRRKLGDNQNAMYTMNIMAINVHSKTESDPFPMIVDTGACISVVPQKIINELDCIRGKPVTIRDYYGGVLKNSTYLVQLKVGDNLHFISCAGRQSGDYGLLGMDVLQHYDIDLYGDDSFMMLQERYRTPNRSQLMGELHTGATGVAFYAVCVKDGEA